MGLICSEPILNTVLAFTLSKDEIKVIFQKFCFSVVGRTTCGLQRPKIQGITDVVIRLRHTSYTRSSIELIESGEKAEA